MLVLVLVVMVTDSSLGRFCQTPGTHLLGRGWLGLDGRRPAGTRLGLSHVELGNGAMVLTLLLLLLYGCS